MYLLAGDEDGHLSVLTARHDSKFFAVDVWKASLKHQVQISTGPLLIYSYFVCTTSKRLFFFQKKKQAEVSGKNI